MRKYLPCYRAVRRFAVFPVWDGSCWVWLSWYYKSEHLDGEEGFYKFDGYITKDCYEAYKRGDPKWRIVP